MMTRSNFLIIICAPRKPVYGWKKESLDNDASRVEA